MHPAFIRIIEQFHRLTKKRKLYLLLVSIVFLSAVIAAVALFMPEQIDWVRTYRPAALKFVGGRSPYEIPSFHNPVWMLFPLVPIALLPVKIGCGVLFVVELLVILAVAVKMGASPVSLVAYCLSFPVMFLLLFGQIEWIVFLGLFFPPWLSLFFLIAKPQVGFVIALFVVVDEWRTKGFKAVLKAVAPVSIALGVTFVLYGFWFLQVSRGIVNAIYNFSLWPLSIPFGLYFLVHSLRKRKKELSLVASPLLSPYVGPHTWSVALLAILPNKYESIVVSISTWMMLLIGLQR